MPDTAPLNVTIKKELKENAEAILHENGVSPEQALTFLYKNIVAKDFDVVGIRVPNKTNT